MSDTRSVDELRARLKDLGYLDAGVDRFVLGSAAPTRSLPGLAALSSLRIGIVVALLLGPLAAIGLAVWLPSLVAGPRDGLILAAYLAVFFGCGAALMAFAAIVLMAVFSPRLPRFFEPERVVRRLAGASGTVVAAATLAYLVLYWRTSGLMVPGWPSSATTVLLLAGAAAVAVLLGHTVSLATLVVLTYRRPELQPPLARRRRSSLFTAGLGLLAFLGGLLALQVVGAPGTTADDLSGSAPPLTAHPAAPLTVIAIDGLDLRFAERLGAAGRLPTLAAALAGARVELIRSDAPDPARTWTSIATGQPADVHGISSIESRRLSGMAGSMPARPSSIASTLAAATDLLRLTHPMAASGLERRAKTFWEIAGEAGLRVVVANWWATWPAPEGGGLVLTDRATLRLERGGSLDAEIAPARLYPALREAWPAVRDEARRRAVAAFPDGGDLVDGVLRRAAEQDLLQIGLLLRVLPGSVTDTLARRLTGVDLLVIYLPGLDIAQYSLVSGPAAAGLPASGLAMRVTGLERYYGFLDRAVAPLLAAGTDADSARRLVVLVTDPGRASGNGRGLLALSGAQAGREALAEPAPIPDVAPTLLFALGLPLSRELPGRAQSSLLAAEFAARRPVSSVATYGRRVVRRPTGAETPLDDAAIERLRSLGYVR